MKFYLLMMVAHHCGLKPGMYTHFIQNVHLYDRHHEIAKEIISRPSSEEQPILIFEPKSDNFYDFTIDDFSNLFNDLMLLFIKWLVVIHKSNVLFHLL